MPCWWSSPRCTSVDITWLHQPPTSSSATSIQQVLGKLAYLDQFGVPG